MYHKGEAKHRLALLPERLNVSNVLKRKVLSHNTPRRKGDQPMRDIKALIEKHIGDEALARLPFASRIDNAMCVLTDLREELGIEVGEFLIYMRDIIMGLRTGTRFMRARCCLTSTTYQVPGARDRRLYGTPQTQAPALGSTLYVQVLQVCG